MNIFLTKCINFKKCRSLKRPTLVNKSLEQWEKDFELSFQNEKGVFEKFQKLAQYTTENVQTFWSHYDIKIFYIFDPTQNIQNINKHIAFQKNVSIKG